MEVFQKRGNIFRANRYSFTIYNSNLDCVVFWIFQGTVIMHWKMSEWIDDSMEESVMGNFICVLILNWHFTWLNCVSVTSTFNKCDLFCFWSVLKSPHNLKTENISPNFFRLLSSWEYMAKCCRCYSVTLYNSFWCANSSFFWKIVHSSKRYSWTYNFGIRRATFFGRYNVILIKKKNSYNMNMAHFCLATFK